jgi:HEAT repeat protein
MQRRERTASRRVELLARCGSTHLQAWTPAIALPRNHCSAQPRSESEPRQRRFRGKAAAERSVKIAAEVTLNEYEILATLRGENVSRRTRRKLVRKLWNVGTDRSVPMLRDCLCAQDVKASVGALQALRLIGTDRAIDAVIGSLPCINPVALPHAAHLLRARGATQAVPELVSCLDVRYDQLGPQPKRAIMYALGKMPHRQSVSVLSRGLNERSRATRKAAARALAGIRAPESRAALEVASRELPFFRARTSRLALQHMAE